jgi:hypothetical protein
MVASNMTSIILQDGESAPFTISGGEAYMTAVGLGPGLGFISIQGTPGSTFPIAPINPDAPDIGRSNLGRIHLNVGRGNRYTITNNSGAKFTFTVWVI